MHELTHSWKSGPVACCGYLSSEGSTKKNGPRSSPPTDCRLKKVLWSLPANFTPAINSLTAHAPQIPDPSFRADISSSGRIHDLLRKPSLNGNTLRSPQTCCEEIITRRPTETHCGCPSDKLRIPPEKWGLSLGTLRLSWGDCPPNRLREVKKPVLNAKIREKTAKN